MQLLLCHYCGISVSSLFVCPASATLLLLHKCVILICLSYYCGLSVPLLYSHQWEVWDQLEEPTVMNPVTDRGTLSAFIIINVWHTFAKCDICIIVQILYHGSNDNLKYPSVYIQLPKN